MKNHTDEAISRSEMRISMTYQQLYEYGVASLSRKEIAEATMDTRRLLEHFCKISWQDLLVHGEKEVGALEQQLFEEAIAKRMSHIPLQQITGIQDFMGLAFVVSKDVLIPRQDTEILVEEVMRYKQDGMRILDMCTGSGCILISLLHYGNHEVGVGVDISQEALEIANQNKQFLLVGEKEQNISFIQSDLFDKVEGKFDLIVSNPPYIETKVIETLRPEVKDYEPMMALDGKEDGLYFYKKIIEKAPAFLAKEGMLFFEIGYNQGKDVSCLMEQAGFIDVKVIRDYAKLDRVVIGTLIQ